MSKIVALKIEYIDKYTYIYIQSYGIILVIIRVTSSYRVGKVELNSYHRCHLRG